MITCAKTECNLHVVLSVGGNAHCQLAIKQDGNYLFSQDPVTTTGTYDIPFTVQAGINTEVSFGAIGTAYQGDSSDYVTLTVTATPAY